ncbi:MAG TPA: hypothetical protein PLZ15_07680 [Melioribacteraceae bacterium]|nr:hypothetical protein [Melioribacteraceae bacterium]
MKSLSKLARHIIIVFIITGLILLIPLIAMIAGDEVVWNLMDFVIAGILLSGAGISFVLLTHKSGNRKYSIATGIAVGAALFMMWANLAVGIIGNEDNPANIMYLWVIGVGVVAAVIAQFKPKGMSYALLATALTQVIVVVIAYIEGNGNTFSEFRELITVNGFFIALWIISSALYLQSAKLTVQKDAEQKS